MPTNSLILFPDARLFKPASRVDAFDESLREIVRNIVDVMSASSAIGLTAVHVGIPRRVVVLRMEAASEPRVYVNPSVLWASQDRVSHEEGSVSLPGVRAAIGRSASVRIDYQDLDGIRREETASGFRAAVLQHEVDQIDGIFWIDRLSRLKRDRLLARYRKIRGVHGEITSGPPR